MAPSLAPHALSQHCFRSIRRHEARKRQDSMIMELRLELGAAKFHSLQLQQQLDSAMKELRAWQEWHGQTWNRNVGVDWDSFAFQVDGLDEPVYVSAVKQPSEDHFGSPSGDLVKESNLDSDQCSCERLPMENDMIEEDLKKDGCDAMDQDGAFDAPLHSRFPPVHPQRAKCVSWNAEVSVEEFDVMAETIEHGDEYWNLLPMAKRLVPAGADTSLFVEMHFIITFRAREVVTANCSEDVNTSVLANLVAKVLYNSWTKRDLGRLLQNDENKGEIIDIFTEDIADTYNEITNQL